MEHCADCGVLRVDPADYFCQWCGNCQVRLSVAAEATMFRSGDWRRDPYVLTVSNEDRTRTTHIRRIETEPSGTWLRVDYEPFSLTAGSKQGIHYWTDLDSHPDAAEAQRIQTGKIRVHWSPGRDPEEIDIWVAPPPALRFQRPASLLLPPSGEPHDPFQIKVPVTWEGGWLRVNGWSLPGVEMPDAWIQHVDVPPVLEPPSGEGMLVIAADAGWLDRNAQLRVQPDGSQELGVELRIRLAAADVDDAVLEHTVLIPCQRPPQLELNESRRQLPSVYVGATTEICCPVRNRNALLEQETIDVGNATLAITEVEIQTWGDHPCDWLRLKTRLPLDVAAGIGQDLVFEVLGDAAHRVSEQLLRQQNDPVNRTVQVGLILKTNASEKPVKHWFTQRVVRRTTYGGVLAIDFGTSGTSFGLQERGKPPHLVVLEPKAHGGDTRTVPTVIRYIEPLPPGHRVEVGSIVQAQLTDLRVSLSSIRDLKALLRHAKAEEPVADVEYTRGQSRLRLPLVSVIGDYLKVLRERLEADHAYLFEDIVITHPVEFGTEARDRFIAAVKLAFGDVHIDPINEPTAAAYNFITKDPSKKPEKYLLAVLDIGAGTSDICLMEVVNRLEDKTCFVEPRILAKKMIDKGGDTLTEFIVDHLKARGQDWLNGQPLYNKNEGLDPDRRTRANQQVLFQWAETEKLRLIGKLFPAAKPPQNPDLPVHLFVGEAGIAAQFRIDESRPRLFPEEFEQTFRAEVETRIAETLDCLAGMLAANDPAEELDYVLLSGKPTRIPLFRTLVSQRHPKAEIPERNEIDPKHHVVTGACRFGRRHDSGRVRIADNRKKIAPFSYGVAEDSAEGYVVTEIVPQNTPLEADGSASGHLAFPLSVDHRGRAALDVMENTTPSDRRIYDDEEVRRPEITSKGEFVLDGLPPEAVVPCELHLIVHRDGTVVLTAKVEGTEHIFRKLERQGE